MKSQLIRKGAAMIAIAAASVSLAAPASAANHAKSPWSAYLIGWSTGDTPNRQKQDRSAGYISAGSISGGRAIKAWMLGFANEDVESGTVTLSSGQHGYVTNQTFQKYGRKQVHMRVQTTKYYSNQTEASGDWSPDS